MGGSLDRGLGDHRGQQREALAAEGTGRGDPLSTNLSREPQKLELWPAAETFSTSPPAACREGAGEINITLVSSCPVGPPRG